MNFSSSLFSEAKPSPNVLAGNDGHVWLRSSPIAAIQPDRIRGIRGTIEVYNRYTDSTLVLNFFFRDCYA